MGNPGGGTSCGQQTLPAPDSFNGAASRLMLKLVALAPRPKLTKMMAALSCSVMFREPPVRGHSVRLVPGVSLIPAPDSCQ